MRATEFRASNIPPSNELLRGFDRREIDSIIAAAQPRRFSAKSLITRQNQPADRFFLLWKGRARYFFETVDGKSLILVWITPGHIFGAAALTSTPSRYLVSTEAVRESIVLVWDGRTIRALTQRFPQLLNNIFLTTMDYLSWYTAAHAALVSQTARDRLAYLLLGYLPSIGKKVTEGIELDVTNEELAKCCKHYSVHGEPSNQRMAAYRCDSEIPRENRFMLAEKTLPPRGLRQNFRFCVGYHRTLWNVQLRFSEKRVPQLVQASSAGRMSGSAQVLLELTDIIINDTAHPDADCHE